MNKYDKARKEQLTRLVAGTIANMGSFSTKAVTCIMMIIAHESMGGTLREQVISFDPTEDARYKMAKDYARGICQVEKFTHDDLWDNSDNIADDFLNVFRYSDTYQDTTADRLVYDDKYSIFIARKKLHMIMAAIPDDLQEMSRYLVKYYNAGGSAKELDYYNAYVEW